MSSSSSSSALWAPGIGLAVGLLALVLHNVQLQPWTLDDAYISFRYAENLARGHGLVYNPGEAVEGYTTFLWVFLLGLGNAVGLPTPVLAKVLGVASATATLGVIASAHRLVDGVTPRASGIGAALVGSCGVFTSWAMPGMEVPLVALLSTLVVLGSVRVLQGRSGSVAVGGVAALALMARPDAIVVVSIAVAAWALRAVRTRDPAALLGLVPLLGLYGPYFLWRYTTYGWLLPNTFYAKVGATEAQLWRGATYVLEASGALGWMVLVGLVALWRADRALALIAVTALGQVAYVVAVGGDVMPAFRFFTGLTPVVALLAAVGLDRLAPRLALVAATLGVAVNLAAFELHPDLHPRIVKGVVGRNGEEVGRWLREHFPDDTLLATNTAGSVPYFSGFPTIDMLGLNDATIAHREMPRMGEGLPGHEKADGAYVFRRDPDIVQFGSARGRARPAFRSDRELKQQPGFGERYVLRRYTLPSGARLTLWVRRTWVEDGTAP